MRFIPRVRSRAVESASEEDESLLQNRNVQPHEDNKGGGFLSHLTSKKEKDEDKETEIDHLHERDEERANEGGPLVSSSPNSPSLSTNNKDSSSSSSSSSSNNNKSSVISKTGLSVLLLLAVQNCSKNLLMRYVMKDQPKFLTSAAVLGSECIKLTLSVLYILFIQRKAPTSIYTYLQQDKKNTLLLVVPASAYNLQMTLEYIALANLNAATFSVLVQSKLLFTATFSFLFLRKRLKNVQVISLVLLTTGVMLCNLSNMLPTSSGASFVGAMDATMIKGILATVGIALSSGFASVYTEKVIKSANNQRTVKIEDYGLAYTQVQLALMSLLTIGIYAMMRDFTTIVQYGLFYNFSLGAVASICSSAIGGLIVAAVLKYADSVLKGYATAISVIATGILSMLLFRTKLNIIYFMGIINVIVAVLLYNGKDLDQYMCRG